MADLRAGLVAADNVRAVFADQERAALAREAQALADENRLLAEDAAALYELTRADAAIDEVARLARQAREAVAAARAKVAAGIAALTPVNSGGAVEDEIAVLSALRDVAVAASDDAYRLAGAWMMLDATAKTAADAVARLTDARAARARIAAGLADSLRAARARRDAAVKQAAAAAARAAAEATRGATLREMLAILESQRQLEELQAREDRRRAQRDRRIEAVQDAKLREAAAGRPKGDPREPGILTTWARPARQLRLPAEGVLLRRWGDPENGQPSKGQSWRTPPEAAVVSPCAGTVAFAQPFRGFGLLIIVDCGGGYHAVLGGMDRTPLAAGKPVRAGDAAGTMPLAPGVLYLELRKAGRPVDPAPWLPVPVQ